MKTNSLALLALPLLLALVNVVPAMAAPSASTLLEKSEDNMRGSSFQALTKMEVVRDDSRRSVTMKIWSRKNDRALVKIVEPVKDRNTGNLRLDLNLWQFLPNVDRLIRVPSSMMLQSWMGSDLTNDDLVKVSSLARDYNSKIVGVEKLDGVNAIRIECIPKPNAPVVWGKVMAWIRKSDNAPMKREFYNERQELLKTFVGSDIKSIHGHNIPTRWVMTNAKKPGSLTRLEYTSIVFDAPLSDDLFTQQNLRKPIN